MGFGGAFAPNRFLSMTSRAWPAPTRYRPRPRSLTSHWPPSTCWQPAASLLASAHVCTSTRGSRSLPCSASASTPRPTRQAARGLGRRGCPACACGGHRRCRSRESAARRWPLAEPVAGGAAAPGPPARWLHVSESSWAGGPRGGGTMHMRHGSPAFVGWTAMLRAAPAILGPNTGVQFAPCLTAAPRYSPGSLTSVTDASGEDGFGGYAFSADRPGEVFILSEPWGGRAAAALEAAASPAQAELWRGGGG
mmetsp:Transcript_42182/g.123472  ORF Transcript_42182/g.123472 Transcript_42182/m.123472 type:complete len:251 (+) Transcript_42182:2162-2914(+)